jgi:hypothetical protein
MCCPPVQPKSSPAALGPSAPLTLGLLLHLVQLLRDPTPFGPPSHSCDPHEAPLCLCSLASLGALGSSLLGQGLGVTGRALSQVHPRSRTVAISMLATSQRSLTAP